MYSVEHGRHRAYTANTATPPMPSRAMVARVPAGGAAPAAGVPLSVDLAAELVAVPVVVTSPTSPTISVDTADKTVDAAVVACAQMLGASDCKALRSLQLQLRFPNKMQTPSWAARAEAPLPEALRQTHVRSVASQPRLAEARARQARAQDGTWAIRPRRGAAVVVVVVDGNVVCIDVCNDVDCEVAEAKRMGIEGFILIDAP
jgi:hypothetical protein